MSNRRLTLFLFALVCSIEVQAQNSTAPTSGNEQIYEGLVFGVGKGTIAICAFGVIGLIICFLKDMTATPSWMVFAGIALPLLVLLILWFCPKQNL